MHELVRELLSAGGPIATALGEGFESRREQIEMGEAVARTLASHGRLLAEAGTGVGKSYAYLAPAMLRAALHGEVVVIATHTIALQEQLLHKDIPLLRRVLEPELARLAGAGSTPARSLNPVLVKGRGNYVSLRRLELASKRQDRLFADAGARRSLHVIEDWARETDDGTRSTLPPLERPGVWDRVQSDSGNCMGGKCPNYRACFYQSARRAMQEGNLLICNHALFFSDLALRAQETGFLPPYQQVILDEGHTVEEVAGEHFGLSLTEGRVHHLLSTLAATRGGKGYLPQLAMHAEPGEVERAVTLVRGAEEASRVFFDSLARLFGSARATSVRIRGAGCVENVLTAAMTDLATGLRTLRENVKNEADKFELNAYAERAAAAGVAAKALVDQSLPESVYWAERSGEGEDSRAGRVSLVGRPIEVAGLLREHLFSRDFGVVVTSATLTTGAAPRGSGRRIVAEGEEEPRSVRPFAHTASRLGCEEAATFLAASPFDFARQVEFIVDLGAGEYEYGAGAQGDGAYTRRLAARVLAHVRETEGGAFVLFTSFDVLNKVAAELEQPLEEEGLPLLVQGRSGSRSEILERFKADERSVLLGAASFWQGVDVRGRSLRNVVITKLPFDSPGQPLIEAREQRIKERGGNAFMEESLPRAVMKFKQGFGRLIRSKSDYGRVVVLDPRIVRSRYGARFLEALPAGVKPRVLEAEPFGERV